MNHDDNKKKYNINVKKKECDYIDINIFKVSLKPRFILLSFRLKFRN